MTRKNIIRYAIEVILLVVLVIVFINIRSDPEKLKFPGKWVPTAGLQGSFAKTMIWDESSQTVLAGTDVTNTWSGIGSYSMSGIEWMEIPTGLSANHMIADFASVNGQILAVYFKIKTEPGGLLIQKSPNQPWEQGTIPPGTEPSCLAVANSNSLFLGTLKHGIYHSTDNGVTWKKTSAGLTQMEIQCLCSDPNNGSILLAGTLNGLYRSEDSGINWRRATRGLPELQNLTVAIEADPFKKNSFMAIVRDDKGRAYIMVSNNSGKSWKTRNDGLAADVQPRAIAYHPTEPEVVFIGTVYDGVYRSNSRGNYWFPMNTDLPITQNSIIIHSLILTNTTPPRVYIGTNLRGTVFEYRL